MYAAPFQYHRAGSVDEALDLLRQHGDGAKLLAGGHSLVPLMKLRLVQPSHVIDIRRVLELSGIREEPDAVTVGAASTHYTVSMSDTVARRLPVLAEASAQVGDPQVRNMGTIGGSIAHADPGADLPAVLLVLEAEIHVVGGNGARVIPADEFFVGLMTTALAPDEIITRIRFPAPATAMGAAYVKHPHPASGYALCGVAAVLTLDGTGRVERARVALTGITARPTRAAAVEQALRGALPDRALLEASAGRVEEGISLRQDQPDTPGYNAHLARVITRRALTRALERVGGQSAGGG